MRHSQAGSKNWIQSTDKILLCSCMLLSAFSCLVLYSCYRAGMAQADVPVTQAAVTLAGSAAAVIVSFTDYRHLARLWPVMLAVSLLLCALLLTPLGFTPAGTDDRAWLRFGFFSFQPSELVKLAFIYTFAYHLSKVRKKINQLPTFLLLCLHGGAYIALITFQGDFGSASVFIAIFVVMMFSAGLSWRFISVGIVCALGLVPFVWKYMLPGYLRRRFYVAWDPSIDPTGDGFQQYRGQLALGSGQITGRGLFAENLVRVPLAHNDFIFAHIGQTLGLAGCAFTILALVFICGKILMVAKKSRDDLGSYICCGVFAVIFYQALINIGMVLCVVPVIGITLPFVSGGGSSLLILYLGIGMVMSVHRDAQKHTLFSKGG